MTEFRTVKEAKDLLANRIADEAKRENVPLSELERKMLYWSEDDLTRPEAVKLAEEFDRDSDDDEYEQKIARLIANLSADHHHQNEAEEEKWDAAVCRLSDGDHYIQVLISEAERVARGPEKVRAGGFLPTSDQPAVRPPHDSIKLVVTALACIPVFFALLVVTNRASSSRFWRSFGLQIDDRGMLIFLFLALAAGYFLVPKLWQLLRARTNRP